MPSANVLRKRCSRKRFERLGDDLVLFVYVVVCVYVCMCVVLCFVEYPREKNVNLTLFFLAHSVVECSKLTAMDASGTSDPYVVVRVNEQVARTKTISKDLNPVFNTTFYFFLPPKSAAPNYVALYVTVYDRDLVCTWPIYIFISLYLFFYNYFLLFSSSLFSNYCSKLTCCSFPLVPFS